MSLHKATELIKKLLIFTSIGIGSIVMIVLVFRIGAMIKNIVSPPKIVPPNQAYDLLPALQFPKSEIDNNFTYTINTVSGALPEFPDRLVVYPFTQPAPNLLNLDKAKTKVQSLRFMDQQNKLLPEVSLGNGKYQWTEPTGINRRIKFDIVTFDFSLTSNYLSNLTVLAAQNLNDENNAILTAKSLLENINLFPDDIDLSKTQTPQPNVNYNTYPQLFNVINGALIKTTSLSSAKVIRVDFYQKDIEYDLDTGVKNAPKIKIKLPILYPNPPYSTMSFWIASGQGASEVDAAEFSHRDIAKPDGAVAIYPIKSAKEAFDELQDGKAYIASYEGLEKNILISNVYLAYYANGSDQQYLMPIIVFEGQNNFLAYVSAVKETSLK